MRKLLCWQHNPNVITSKLVLLEVGYKLGIMRNEAESASLIKIY